MNTKTCNTMRHFLPTCLLTMASLMSTTGALATMLPRESGSTSLWPPINYRSVDLSLSVIVEINHNTYPPTVVFEINNLGDIPIVLQQPEIYTGIADPPNVKIGIAQYLDNTIHPGQPVTLMPRQSIHAFWPIPPLGNETNYTVKVTDLYNLVWDVKMFNATGPIMLKKNDVSK